MVSAIKNVLITEKGAIKDLSIAVLNLGEVCPMPYALCPMPYALYQACTALLLRKAICMCRSCFIPARPTVASPQINLPAALTERFKLRTPGWLMGIKTVASRDMLNKMAEFRQFRSQTSANRWQEIGISRNCIARQW